VQCSETDTGAIFEGGVGAGKHPRPAVVDTPVPLVLLSAYQSERLYACRITSLWRNPMLLDKLRHQRDAIHALGRRYGAAHIRVFGSVARGDERPDSDVDILVDFPRGYDLFSQRLPLTEGLADIVGRRVELVPEHELNRHIRDRILAEAVDL